MSTRSASFGVGVRRLWNHHWVLSLLLYALLAVVAVGVLFAVAVLLLPSGTQIAATSPDQPPVYRLPEERLDADAVAAVRLPVALRGYRFAETDLLLSRLVTELAERDAELAQLRDAGSELAASLTAEAPDQSDEPA